MKALTIRLATPDDAPPIQAIYVPYILDSSASFETEVPAIAEIAERITATLSFFPWLVCEDDGVVIGYAYASAHRTRAAYRWSVDVSVYIAKSHQRRGIGRRLYTELFALLRQQGFYNTYAGITLPNAASVGLHEALGFTLVGIYRATGYKHGAWHDVGWWEMPLRPASATPPPEPRGIHALGTPTAQ